MLHLQISMTVRMTRVQMMEPAWMVSTTTRVSVHQGGQGRTVRYVGHDKRNLHTCSILRRVSYAELH